MSDFPSLSSAYVFPPSFNRQRRTDAGHISRPNIPHAESSKSRDFLHRHSSSDTGSSSRYLGWKEQRYLPSSSKPCSFSYRNSIGDALGHGSAAVPPQTPPSNSKVRSSSSATLSCNEVSPVFRVRGCRSPVVQAHQSEHAPNGCTTQLPPLVFPQVSPISLNAPPFLSSSLASSSPFLTTPLTPQSHRSVGRHHRHSVLVTLSASPSLFKGKSPCEADQPRCERYTPSPSPLSHATRELRTSSHRSSPSTSSRCFSIRRGFAPLPPRPTLAMSMQIHAPTPVLSTRPTSPPLPSTARPRSRSRARARSTSRPSSPLTSTVPLPQRPPMPRPPSRSERLLRDTLRRAEEQERTMNPTPSSFGLSPPPPSSNLPPAVVHMFGPCRLPAAVHGGRRHRRNTSSSVQSDSSCDYFDGEIVDESPEDEEDNDWMWRTNSAASSSSNSSGHGYSQAYYPTHIVSANKAEAIPYGTPASPSPARAQLQRAAKSSSSVPRRHSHSQSVSHVAAHPPSRTSVDADHIGHTMTPHEVVLRSRLEGVLKNAKAHDRRTRSVERRDPDSGFSSGSGNSMASSRNMSGEGDFFFGAGGDSSLTSLSSNDVKRRLGPSALSSPRPSAKQVHMLPPASPRSAHKPLSSLKDGSPTAASPLTPPPSPPFNARQAAVQCKAIDGYVSFANIEGLGVPEGSDDEADEDAKSRSRWFQWLHISGKTATNDRVRGRSESSSSASR